MLDAIDDGALTVTEISASTGVGTEMVRTALEQLRRMGRLSSEPISVGCPPSGCGSCAVASTGECATGPVLVGLSLRAG